MHVAIDYILPTLGEEYSTRSTIRTATLLAVALSGVAVMSERALDPSLCWNTVCPTKGAFSRADEFWIGPPVHPSKSAQQRIVCRDTGAIGTPESCRRPLLLMEAVDGQDASQRVRKDVPSMEGR